MDSIFRKTKLDRSYRISCYILIGMDSVLNFSVSLPTRFLEQLNWSWRGEKPETSIPSGEHHSFF